MVLQSVLPVVLPFLHSPALMESDPTLRKELVDEGGRPGVAALARWMDTC